MSGIAGIFQLDGRPVDGAILQRMTGKMAHRGPDGIRHWVDGAIGLGGCMLHTTPESLQEILPWVDEEAGICLVFDGRVDNRAELRVAIESRGQALRTDTDAELVLRAYQCWEEEAPAHILGDFAFALWDGPRRKLFCARDPFRGRPFFFARNGSTFAFASEMQPLFEVPGMERKPNLPLLCAYLLRRFTEQEETLYEGVCRLRPAYSLVVEGAEVRQAQYWDVDPDYSVRFSNDADYSERFLELFQDAVRVRLRSCKPVALTLSGGLDSSSIACAVGWLQQQGLVQKNGFETFSIVFDRYPCDERSYSAEVVRKWNLKANFIRYEEQCEPWMDLEKVYEYPDAFFAPAVFLFAPVLQAIRNRDIHVLLDGYGGDELLAAGFGHITDVMRQGNPVELVRTLRHTGVIYGVHPVRLFWDHCVKPVVPQPVRTALKPLVQPFRRKHIPAYVRPEFLKTPAMQERLQHKMVVRKMPTRSQQVIYDGLFAGWNATVAWDMTDLVTSRFLVERRHPFLDRRVAEFLLALPEEQRWRGDWAKIVLRNAMQDLLPESVQWRKRKAEFSAPVDWELRHRQRRKVEQILSRSVLDKVGIIDGHKALEFFGYYRQNGTPYLVGSMELLIGLELWCRGTLGIAFDEEVR